MSVSPIHTRIWHEVPEPNNPFAAKAARCFGYDVYGEILGRASWAQMIYLLFKGEVPSTAQATLLENLAVALANPGPRDPSVHAAMCGGVGGSPAAASLLAALAVGAGSSGGARDLYLALTAWSQLGPEPDLWLDSWRGWIDSPPVRPDEAWPDAGHPPGFDPNGVTTATTILQTLECLASTRAGPRLPWLLAHREDLEARARLPISIIGVAAAAFADLGLTPDQGEMLLLLLRLPGAAVHALEQPTYGFKQFPFYPVELLDDPMTRIEK